METTIPIAQNMAMKKIFTSFSGVYVSTKNTKHHGEGEHTIVEQGKEMFWN